MPLLSVDALTALVAAGCPSCQRHHLTLRVFATGTIRFLDGEPVSNVRWAAADGELHERLYRAECGECGALLWQRDDCPRCRAPACLARALGGRHGIVAPRACPSCDSEELDHTAVLRARELTTQGHVGRRVADAEPHEPGFHVVAVTCPSCEETVATPAADRCALCGRSSLLKRLG